MKILVTGTQGQLALSLAERAAGNEQLRVSLVGRPDLDLAIAGSSRSAIISAHPDLVINAAAFTAVDLAETEGHVAGWINDEAAGEIASAAREVGAPVIHISTDYVFDGQATEPYVETASPNPINAYGRSKLAGEEAVRAANPNHLILRTSWLVSPFGRNFVRTMVELAQVRDTLSVIADQYGSPTSALDLADAILVVARRWKTGDRTRVGQTYHIAGTGVASWYDLAVAVENELSQLGLQSARVVRIKTAEWPTAAARPAYSALDTSAFTRDFGYLMQDWRVAVATVVERLAMFQSADEARR